MLSVIFYGAKNETLKISGNNLRDVLKLQQHEKFKLQPIAIRFESNKLLFYHENVIRTFVNEEDMSIIELLDFCICTAVYRCTADFENKDNTCIDNGSLWKEIGNNLVLVDDDQYVETQLNQKYFEKIV